MTFSWLLRALGLVPQEITWHICSWKMWEESRKIAPSNRTKLAFFPETHSHHFIWARSPSYPSFNLVEGMREWARKLESTPKLKGKRWALSIISLKNLGHSAGNPTGRTDVHKSHLDDSQPSRLCQITFLSFKQLEHNAQWFYCHHCYW